MTEQQSKGAGLLLHNTLPNKEAYSNISEFFKTSVIKNIYIFICLEKEMATHSSILAWKSPWTEEPGHT